MAITSARFSSRLSLKTEKEPLKRPKKVSPGAVMKFKPTHFANAQEVPMDVNAIRSALQAANS